MAEPPATTTAPAPNPLEGEANDRLRDARRWKELWVLDFKECYFFAAPHRQRQISSQTAPPTQRLLDAPELNTDLAFILCPDFVTEVVNTYMPEAQQWCKRAAGMDVPDEMFDEVKDEVAAGDKKIFGAMKASNLYSEIPKAFDPDLAIGCAGLWIHRPHAHAPIEVLAVPLREMEINLGPNGEIDDRFVIRFTRNCYVKSLLGKEIVDKLPADIAQTIDDKPTNRTEVRWGFWRKWDDISDEVWQHVVMVGQKLVHDVEIKGEGCCPFLPMRFSPSADWPWGIGPMMKGLPTLRQVDELDRQKLENIELHLTPPITYPNDSFTNVEQGLESGMAYPITPGSEGAVKPIYKPESPDAAVYATQDMEHRLRKLFYVDYPEQTGDTPPTLGQWLDEMARAQRRIGTPGASFYREGPMRIFIRFKYLLERAGTIKAIKDKQGRAISTQALNPAQRAAEQQEIATATQAASILGQMFPEEWKMAVDGTLTIKAFVEKMRVSGLIKMRDAGKVASALDQIKQLILSRQAPGAPVPEGAGAPAAAA